MGLAAKSAAHDSRRLCFDLSRGTVWSASRRPIVRAVATVRKAADLDWLGMAADVAGDQRVLQTPEASESLVLSDLSAAADRGVVYACRQRIAALDSIRAV